MSPVAAFTRAHEPLPEELDVSRNASAAFLEEIFREHSLLVYRTAYSVTGSAQDAEDIVETLFLQLLRRGFPLDFRKNPKGYLYRAAVNHALNAVKSNQRRASLVDPARLELAADVPAEAQTFDREADLQERLVAAIAQLKPRAVEMLVLRYEHNCSEAEIGTLLGTSRGVVAVTLYRARARLKKLLRASAGDRPSAGDRRGRPSGRPEDDVS
jgi:RNA polymerase sigma-70 factor (ECF subfamily)